MSSQRQAVVKRLLSAFLPVYRLTIGRMVKKLFMLDLVTQTDNFRHVKWLGQPLWQNTTDLWTIQEVIADIRPALLIETGTYEGGSARFYASLMDLMDHGRVLTIDLSRRPEIDHPRVTLILSSSRTRSCRTASSSRATRMAGCEGASGAAGLRRSAAAWGSRGPREATRARRARRSTR